MESLRTKSVCLPRSVASIAWGLTTLGCLLAAGCNQGKQLHSDIIARELRLQEDEIYRLEDYLEEYQRKVCILRAENHQLQEQLGAAQAVPAKPSAEANNEDDEGDLPEDDDLPERSASETDVSDEDEPPTDVPVIDFGTPIDDPPPALTFGGEAPPAEAAPGSEAPRFEPAAPEAETLPAGELPLPEQVESPAPVFQPLSFEAEGDAQPLLPISHEQPIISTRLPIVERVTIASRPGPAEPDGQPTLAIRVTPQFESETTAIFAGEVSLMLRDPQAMGDTATVARWDYTPAEVAAHAEPNDDGSFQFLIGLPDKMFSDRSLELWVRFVDELGNKTLGMARVVLTQELAPRRASEMPPSVTVVTPPALPIQGLIQQANWEEPAVTPAAISLPPAPSEVAEPTESTLRIIINGEPAKASNAAAATDQPTSGWRKSRDAEASRLLEPVVSLAP